MGPRVCCGGVLESFYILSVFVESFFDGSWCAVVLALHIRVCARGISRPSPFLIALLFPFGLVDKLYSSAVGIIKGVD